LRVPLIMVPDIYIEFVSQKHQASTESSKHIYYIKMTLY
jgi:hypothetical protein